MLIIAITASLLAADSPEKEIADLVLNSQRAGLVRGDTAAYIAPWARDGRWVMQRGPEPKQKYELIVDYKRGLARAELRSAGEHTTRTLEHEKTEVLFSKDGTLARYVCTAVVQQEGYTEKVREIYLLRRTGSGWRIYENRFWPKMTLIGTKLKLFGSEYWAHLDQAVSDTAKGDEPVNHVYALMDAHRWAEAYASEQALTKSGGAKASDWALRAVVALVVARVNDARYSVRKARSVDPKVRLPPWAAAIK